MPFKQGNWSSLHQLPVLRPHSNMSLKVALPELDGGIEPIVFAGRDSNTGKSHSLPDRIDSLASRAINWAKLAKKKVAEKKLAITVFSFPPDKGNVGTAAYLNVFGSIHRVLQVRCTPEHATSRSCCLPKLALHHICAAYYPGKTFQQAKWLTAAQATTSAPAHTLHCCMQPRSHQSPDHTPYQQQLLLSWVVGQR